MSFSIDNKAGLANLNQGDLIHDLNHMIFKEKNHLI